jgi:hypothetical protein
LVISYFIKNEQYSKYLSTRKCKAIYRRPCFRWNLYSYQKETDQRSGKTERISSEKKSLLVDNWSDYPDWWTDIQLEKVDEKEIKKAL